MQKCKRCGQDLSDDARICRFCGQPVESEDEERRRRLMLRWHLSALLLGRKRSARGFLFSPALSGIPSSQRLPASILVFLTSVFILLNIVLAGVLRAHTGSVSTPPLTFTFPLPPSVNPTLLDFGKVEVGSQAVLPVIVKTSSESELRWRAVSGNAQWLSITVRTEAKEPDNTREVIYAVTANTSKLQVGPYSETLSVRSDGGKEQRVDVKVQVIPPGPPQPAKLNVNPLVLDFGSQNKGNPKTLLLTVSNSGGRELSWTAGKGKTPWLTLDTSGGKIPSGEPPQVIKVRVDTTSLTAGPYSALINFTSNGGNAVVDVRLNVVSTPITEQGPIVSSISPKCELTAGGATVIITGSGFTGATNVSFGSTAGTIVSVDSDGQITAISPTGSGTVDVTVTTPGGTSATSTADQFTYPPPTVTSISPTSGPTGGGSSVTITGSGFTCATGVSFGSTAGTIISISNTQITAISPAGSGRVDVIVTTPEGTTATSAADLFTYIPPPTVTSINPTSEPSISGGNTVTINGSGFTSESRVSCSQTAASNVTFINDTQLTVVSPAVSSCTIVDVTVTTPGGTSATSRKDKYEYCPPQ